jgi:hypothetical protein
MAEERFIFSDIIKKWLLYVVAGGLFLAIAGILLIMFAHPAEEVAADGYGHHGPVWLDRLWTAIWVNNMFFIGISIIGVFFVAVNYAAQSGWFVAFKRIPEAFGQWLPIAGIITVIVFLIPSAQHTLFHWTADTTDPIILGKRLYLNVPLFVARTILYFGLWYFLYLRIKRYSQEEDLHGGVLYWHKARKYSVIFIVIFAITSSMASWDWLMSTDPHWFSTIYGWYVFAGWFVIGLVTITLLMVGLKDFGYFPLVNANHLHDMGKYIFAFSIFWTYLWFSQYMLIYYADIPEESLYYVERLRSPVYKPMFFANIIVNFLFPFLVLMTRESKRHGIFLKIVGVVLLIGHWMNIYLLVAPSTVGDHGAIGLLELGIFLLFAAGFLFVIFNALAKAPLMAKNHPMLDESLHYHT